MLNPDSPVPLYHQLALIIQGKIESKEFLPGSKIPSENELSKKYGIGRPTVRQAIESLVRKNIIEKKKGSGSFVNAVRIEVDLFSLAGTSAAFFNKGISIKTEYLTDIKLITLPLKKQSKDNPFLGRKAYFLSRIHKIGENPFLFEDIYLDEAVLPGIDKYDLKTKHLSEIVRDYYYMKPVGGKQTFEIYYPELRIKELMMLSKETPVLMVKRFIHFKQASNVIYSEIICRTDQFVFSQTLCIS